MDGSDRMRLEIVTNGGDGISAPVEVLIIDKVTGSILGMAQKLTWQLSADSSLPMVSLDLLGVTIKVVDDPGAYVAKIKKDNQNEAAKVLNSLQKWSDEFASKVNPIVLEEPDGTSK